MKFSLHDDEDYWDDVENVCESSRATQYIYKYKKIAKCNFFLHAYLNSIRREFLREILYKNIAIIAIQHSNMYFVDTSGDFSYTVG